MDADFQRVQQSSAGNKLNIFEGVQRNKFFIVINCIMVGAQVAIVFVGGKAFSITPIDGVQWAICVVLAALCLPWAILVRLFPDSLFEVIAKTTGRPVVTVYQALRRTASRIGQKMRRAKSVDSEKTDVEAIEVVVEHGGLEKKA